jgi:bifunctional non-homologous end joining protein LigD
MFYSPAPSSNGCHRSPGAGLLAATRARLDAEELLSLPYLPREVDLQLGEDLVSLTSLDRLYWPADGITKGDLLRYYLQVSPVILPLLQGRPAVLRRFPQGAAGYSFFQHRVEDGPPFLRRERLPHGGSEIDYAVYSGAAALLYLVNLGNIEQHPWQSRAESRDTPDFLVIDLDPHLAAWPDVVEVALETRTALAALGLQAWVKTSGGKGLHVYVPLAPGATHSRVRDVAEAVCRFVAGRLPRIATAERRTSARRRGQVYLDWVQNGYGRCLAAAYSVRARARATVSCPLTWEELEAGATLSQFTLRTVPERLARGIDPWKGILDRGQPLP